MHGKILDNMMSFSDANHLPLFEIDNEKTFAELIESVFYN